MPQKPVLLVGKLLPFSFIMARQHLHCISSLICSLKATELVFTEVSDEFGRVLLTRNAVNYCFLSSLFLLQKWPEVIAL